MSTTIADRLKSLGISLPAVPAAAGKYVPATRTGNLIYTSGQLPLKDGALVATGLLGREVSTEDGAEAAKWAALNVLAQIEAAAGSLDKVKRIVKITVFVASTPDYTTQHLVANGASQAFLDVLGDAGAHARSAVGMASLPLNAAVEVEAIAELA